QPAADGPLRTAAAAAALPADRRGRAVAAGPACGARPSAARRRGPAGGRHAQRMRPLARLHRRRRMPTGSRPPPPPPPPPPRPPPPRRPPPPPLIPPPPTPP